LVNLSDPDTEIFDLRAEIVIPPELFETKPVVSNDDEVSGDDEENQEHAGEECTGSQDP
jgi:hypothetical protein